MAAVWVMAAPVAGAETELRGLTLTAALQRLQAQGLAVFFSSQLVRGSMRVESAPRSASPREILDEILRPHGLYAVEVMADRLVVVAGPPPRGTLRGQVVSRADGRPLAGVRVVVAGTPGEATTAVDGSFVIPDLAAGVHTVEAHRHGYAGGRWPGVEIAAQRDRRMIIALDAIPTVKEEIVVTPSRYEVRREEAAGALALGEADATALPHLADDPFRALGVLPGAASSEASSRLNIRGGRDDEVLVVLDGLELLAPYHLQEFDSALSIVAPSFLDQVQLRTGGYPAEYGDRMSGVLEMTTLTPPRSRRFELGLGLLAGEISAAGSLPRDRGRWYGAARGGTYRLPLEIHGRGENPRFGDVFGKLDFALRPGQTLQLNALAAADEYRLSPDDEFGLAEPVGERYRGRWGNQYLWLTHGAVARPELFIESMVSAGRVDRGRSGSVTGGQTPLEVRDFRLLDVAGVKHVWRAQLTAGRSLEGGVELRRLHSNIDYRSEGAFVGLAGAREPTGGTRFRRILAYDQSGAFVSSRLRPAPGLTAELGARYDGNGATGESHVSPRLNLAWTQGKSSVLRLAWGWFHQSQRPNELQVEDGETELARDQRAEHRIAGFEHRRGNGATLRVEAYQRRISRPRVRFENLFDPIVLFPELTGDRLRLAPDGGQAEGIELFFRGAPRGPLGWWLTYSYSSVKDDYGGRRLRRAGDQPHALRADLDYRTVGGWSFNAVWLYHTGWPTTRVTGRAVPAADGSARLEPVLGPLYGERLADYHRLDLRVRRAWELRLGRLDAYLDLQNLYDRENVRGFDAFTFDRGPAGDVRVHAETLSWGGFLPSFGIRWRL